MLRKTLSSFAAEDIVAQTGVVIETGTVLTLYRIERNNDQRPSTEIYQMVFEADGRMCRCPLYRFQPRTQALEAVQVSNNPARESIAV